MKAEMMMLALLACAGTAFAAPREAMNAPAALETDDPGSTFSLTFTGSQGGSSYTAQRIHLTGTLVSNTAGTWASDVEMDITTPGGGMLTVLMGTGGTYATQSFDLVRALPGAPISPAGEWQFALRDTFQDGPGTPDSLINDLVVTLDDEPQPAPAATDLHEIGGGDGSDVPVLVTNAAIDSGGQIVWFKFSTAADALNGTTDYFDVDTYNPDDGAPAVGSINDTMIAVYAVDGSVVSEDDDSSGDYHSLLTFGADDPANWRPAHGNGYGGDGFNGDLVTGTYYLAVGCYAANFDAPFIATSTSAATGTILVNFYTNLPGGTTGPACGLADVGGVGGVAGADNHLDNNDFVVFIDFFFNHNPIADQGSTGGAPGADGAWDNNDFVVFIDNFFTAPASCR
jgi:hypothetical protein